MNGSTSFRNSLLEEANRVKGVYYPVRAGFLRRVLVKKTACSKLHPNPDDEFCFPEIGPNDGIISGYEQDYRRILDGSASMEFIQSGIKEPLMVEKTRPDGYMILNGHHRWAAAKRVGIKKLRIKIVDLTQLKDIREMLKSSGSDKRVSLDLDEVVFRPAEDSCLEKPLRFPLNRFYRERIRLGIPALFHALNSQGYDIWIYTARYYSFSYLKYYFKHYRVPVTGIVTGTARKGPFSRDTLKEMERLFDAKYRETIHIDQNTILCTSKGSHDFEEYRLNGSSESWSREVMETIDRRRKGEQANRPG